MPFADVAAIGFAIAQSIGRWGNLINQEAFGGPTNLPWGFIFELRGETVAKHPTQLYEALSYLFLGVGLLLNYKYRLPKLKEGWTFGVFLIVLFGMRFLIEYIKEPQVAFEEGMSLNMGQLLSVPFIIAGIIMLVYSYVRKKPAAIKKQ